MKNIYRGRWFRVLPLVVLAVVLFADIIRVFIPLSSASGTGFSSYHDSFYGYSISYPKDWKITHDSAHITIFVAPDKTATCQVSIQVTRKVLSPQKALMSTLPQGAYSISHKMIDGSPALAFSQYRSSVLGPDGKFTSASTKKVVVAQANTAHGTNLYTLSLDMFHAAFVGSKNVEPHTACEANFEVMANSLVLAPGTNGLANVVSGVLTDPNNPAIQFAEAYWNFTSYDHTAGLYCSFQQRYTGAYTTAKCGDNVNNKKVIVPDNYYYQPVFECAEFVARALANEKYISFDPYNFPAVSNNNNDLGHFQGYDLLYVGDTVTKGNGLYQYLTQKVGGVDIGDNPGNAQPGDVVFYSNSSGGLEHVALLTATGTQPGGTDTLIDAHNLSSHDTPYSEVKDSYGNLLQRTIIHLPSLSTTPVGVTLYGSYYYNTNASSTSTTFYNAGFYRVSSPVSSIAIQPGWFLIAYQNANGSGGLQKTFYANAPDLRNVTFDNSSQVVDKQIGSVMIYSTRVCSSQSANTKRLKTNATSCQPPPCPNTAAFITDVTYPDGTAVSSGQSFNKTWRLQNTSTCTWSGFTLNFISGAQMNGPASVPVPTTGPGQAVDITIPLVAPTSGGTYRGNWQLEDSQGVAIITVARIASRLPTRR